jgi:8-oxo-dGTP pyrophosphatase MutT (NUDIX family)
MYVREPITECGVILLNKNLDSFVIIFQNESLKWGLPKGHMESWEIENKRFFECAKRELMEETGIMINTHKYRKMGTFVLKNKLFFVIRLMRDIRLRTPYDTVEIGRVKWLDIQNIYTFLEYNKCNTTIKDSCKYISTIYQYRHRVIQE